MLRTLRACGVSARRPDRGAPRRARRAGARRRRGRHGRRLPASPAALLPDVAASLRGLYGARVPGSLGLGAGLVGGRARHERCSARSPPAGAASGAPGGCRCWRRRSPRPGSRRGAAGAAARARRSRRRLGARRRSRRSAFGRGLPAGFAVIGGLLLGRGAGAAGGARRCSSRWPAAPRAGRWRRWVWADARQALGPLSLALMALLLALAVNVGVGTMVESFRRTFLGYLDQRLAAEVYVAARDPAEAAAIGRLARRPARGGRGAAGLERADAGRRLAGRGRTASATMRPIATTGR